MRRKICMLLLSASLIITAAGCSGGTAAPAMEEEKSVAVETQIVSKASIEAVSALSGKVKPREEISIVPKVPGKAAAVNVKIGHRVKTGDILFSLDDSDIRQQVSQAESALRIAESSYINAKKSFENTAQLYELGGVSKLTYETSESSFKMAEEQFKSAQAAYQLAKSQLDSTIVRSPIDGLVAAVNASAGEMVSNAVPAVTVVDISSVTVDINVPETMVNKVKKGDEVDVLVAAVSSEAVKGKIESISPTADARTQSYPISITITNANEVLKGGMFAEVKLKADTARDVLAVPLSSVVEERDKKYVYVANGDRAQKREVQTGLAGVENVQILSGLNENESIIVKGQNFLSDGALINIVNK
jgi:HlyD family secretion protein